MDARYFLRAALILLFTLLQFCAKTVSAISVEANKPLRGLKAELVCSFSPPADRYIVKWEREIEEDDILIAAYDSGDGTSRYGGDDDRYMLTFKDGSKKSSATLAISDVSLDDIGSYRCELFGASTPSATVRLEVLVPPDEIGIIDSRTNLEVPNDGILRVTANQPTIITCMTHFSGTRPATELVWSAQDDIVETSSITAVIETPAEPRLEQTSSEMNFTTTLDAHGKWLECQGNHDGLDKPLRSRLTLDVDVAPSRIQLKKSLIADYVDGENVTLMEGSQFTIRCVVPATKPEVQLGWLLDDRPLDPSWSQSTTEVIENRDNELLKDTMGSLVIGNPGRELHGKSLKCVGTGADGIRVEGAISLKVQECTGSLRRTYLGSRSVTGPAIEGPPDAPQIVEVPDDLRAGERASFSCSAHNGYPAPNIRWMIDGQTDVTSNATQGEFPQGLRYTTSSILNLYPTRELNGKELSCVVAEYEGMQDTVTLDIKYCPEPFEFSTCPSVLDRDIGTVTCMVGPSNPAVGVTLSLNDENVEVFPRVVESTELGYPGMVTRVDYTSPRIYRENGPFTYTCCATQRREDCPQLPCAECVIDVQYAPIISSITRTPESNIRIGSEVVITCVADANPLTVDLVKWESKEPGTSTWVQYNATNGAWDGANQWQLILTDLQISDARAYRCKADNGIGQAVYSEFARVAIMYTPIIEDSVPTLVRTREGRDKALVCTAWGNPTPTITWYNATRFKMETDPGKHVISESMESENRYNGSLVRGELNFFYVRREKHFGIYYCNASNSFGSTLLKIVLNGTSVPETPSNLREIQRSTTSTSLSFVWTPGEDGGETQMFDVSFCPVRRPSECKDLELTESNYTTTGLTPYTKYRIVVYSHNAVGYSSQSLTREGITLPLSPAKEGLDITYNSVSGEVLIAENPKGSFNIDELPCIKVEVRLSTSSAWEEQLLPCLMKGSKVTIPKDLPQSSIRVKSCIPDSQMCSSVEPIALAVITEEPPTKLIIIIAAIALACIVFIFICVLFIVGRRKPHHSNIHNGEHLEMKNRADGYKSFSKDYDNNTQRAEKEAFLPPVYTERSSLYEPITVVDPKSPKPYDVHKQPNGHGIPIDSNAPTTDNPNGIIYAEIGHKMDHPRDRPPIRTEEQTDYADLDFQRMEEMKENKKNEENLMANKEIAPSLQILSGNRVLECV